jgi:hypothetical protein
MKPITEPQKERLELDTFALIRRHGWDPFSEAVEEVCRELGLRGRIAWQMWKKRAELVSHTRFDAPPKPSTR